MVQSSEEVRIARMAGTSQSGTGPVGGPKILLAKPSTSRPEGSSGVTGGGGFLKLTRDRDENNAARVGLPHGKFNLLSDTWEFCPNRFFPAMSNNTDYMVLGVLGPPSVGKSTIMNELYGFGGTTPEVLPPFPVQSEETRAGARHASVGMELRISAERLILLDCQPLFSASVLMDMMRSDGFANISVNHGDKLSAELAHELIGLQLGVFLSSVCHVFLVVSEGLSDYRMWKLMDTVEMLKQGIPDPSTLPPAASAQIPAVSSTTDKDDPDPPVDELPEFFSDVIFVHTKLKQNDLSWPEIQRLERALSLYFPSPGFRRNSIVQYRPPQYPANGWQFTIRDPFGRRRAPRGENGVISLSGLASTVSDSENEASFSRKEGVGKGVKHGDEKEHGTGVNFFVLPVNAPDELTYYHHESYTTMLAKLRNEILSMPRKPFARSLSERDWLRNAARVWDLVKRSPVMGEYSKFLQSSGLYRR